MIEKIESKLKENSLEVKRFLVLNNRSKEVYQIETQKNSLGVI